MKNKYVYGLTIGMLIAASVGCSSLQACQTAECQADAKITAEVRGRLNAMPSMANNNISVQTSHGVVYLYGAVDTKFEQNLVLTAAQGVGAKEVYDDTYVLGN